METNRVSLTQIRLPERLRRPGALTLLLVLLLHGAAFLTLPMMEVTSDSRTYMMWAATLIGPTPWPATTVCFHAPGYYWLMALLMPLSEAHWKAVLYLLQHAAWLAAAAGVWRLFAFWFSDRSPLLPAAAALAATCSPSALLSAQRLMPDSLGASLSLAGMSLLVSALLRRRRPGGAEFWTGCALFALALTIRTEKLVLLLPVVAALAAVSGRNRRALAGRILVLGAAVSPGLLLPCAFNQAVWGRFIPALNGNKIFELLGTAGVIRGDEGPVTRDLARRLASAGAGLRGQNAWQVRAVLREQLGIGDEYEIDRLLGESAGEVLRARPGEYVLVGLRNTAWQFARDGMVPTVLPPPAEEVSHTIFSPSPVLNVPVFQPWQSWYAHGFRAAYYATLLPALLGAAFLFLRGSGGPHPGRPWLFWGAALLSQASIGFLCTPYARYSIGVVPFLFALWGSGLAYVVHWLSERCPRSGTLPAMSAIRSLSRK